MFFIEPNTENNKSSKDFLEKLKVLSKNLEFPKGVIHPFELKTVFPIFNIRESEKNGLTLLVNELKKISGQITLPLSDFGNIPLEFSFSETIEPNEFNISKEVELYLTIHSKTNINMTTVAEKAREKNSDTGDIKIEFLIPSYYKLLHKTCLTHFLQMTQIAYPGTLWLGDGIVYSKNKKVDEVNGISSILSEKLTHKNKWPKFECITINEVWDYIIKKTNILNDFSKTKIERAINSYSYLFAQNYHSEIPVSLFWAISGLEALYVSGETGISQQLNEKIQIFLGEITENKKSFKKLYNYRSKLIHGSLSIPLNGSISDEKHVDELYETNCFASVILVASIQKIIKNNMTKLEFRYTYE